MRVGGTTQEYNIEDLEINNSNQIGYYVKGIKLNSIHGSYTIVDDVEYKLFPTPQEAYAALIDKLGGKGTWDKNEWVWAIEFELNK